MSTTLGPQRIGRYREYTVTLSAGTFTGAEPVSAALVNSAGVEVAALGIAWLDASARTLTLTVDEDATEGLDPGTYRIDIEVEVAGEPLDAVEDYYLALTGPGPAVSPVSLEEARHHLRVELRDDDGYIGFLLRAATRAVERKSGVILVRRSVTSSFAGFPSGRAFRLPYGPLVSVESIAYEDASDTAGTFTGFVTSAAAGRVVLAYDSAWPITRDGPGSVAVTYTAGFAPGECPESYRLAVLMAVADWYGGRITPAKSMALPDAAYALIGLEDAGDYP